MLQEPLTPIQLEGSRLHPRKGLAEHEVLHSPSYRALLEGPENPIEALTTLSCPEGPQRAMCFSMRWFRRMGCSIMHAAITP